MISTQVVGLPRLVSDDELLEDGAIVADELISEDAARHDRVENALLAARSRDKGLVALHVQPQIRNKGVRQAELGHETIRGRRSNADLVT